MSAAATYAPSPRPVTPPPAAPSEPRAMMQMGAQPPARTVYQRALKPSPCVYFVVPALPAVESSQFQQLRLLRQTLDQPDVGGGVWVEAGLVDEQGNRLADSLDGITAVRLQKSGWHDGVYTATFKKLKLLITSQQKAGSQFCLRFSLKCASLDLGPLGEMAVLSNPMAVFSHTQYLGGSSPGSSSASSSSSSSSSSSTITRKYAHNPVGLQLKVMEMIYACKELGGSEEVLHQGVAAVFADGFSASTIPESLLGRSTESSRNPATTSTSGDPARPPTTLFDAAHTPISSAPSPLAAHYAAFNNCTNSHRASSHLHSSADEATFLPPPEPTSSSRGKRHRGLDAPATTSRPSELAAQPQPLLPSLSSAFHVVGRPTTVPPLIPSLPSIFPSLAFSPQPLPASSSATPLSPPDVVGGPASLRGLLSLLREKVASDSNQRKHPWPEGGAIDHRRPPPSAKRRRTNAGARARAPDRPQR